MDTASLCAPPSGWRRIQAYKPQSIGDGNSAVFTFYDQGSCDSGWMLDLTANRDSAGDLWEAVYVIRARDGLRGDTWRATWGDTTLGAPRLGGSVRLFVPYPMLEVTIYGKAAAAQTGTVLAQGIALERSAGRGVGGTTAIGYRTQTLAAGGGNTSYPVPPGAVAYRVGAGNGSSTAIKVSELANGDDDLGTYSLNPGNIASPMEWYPTPPPTDPNASSSQSAIQLGTPGGAEDWTVSFLFDFEG
jgi:hypothetical protein